MQLARRQHEAGRSPPSVMTPSTSGSRTIATGPRGRRAFWQLSRARLRSVAWFQISHFGADLDTSTPSSWPGMRVYCRTAILPRKPETWCRNADAEYSD